MIIRLKRLKLRLIDSHLESHTENMKTNVVKLTSENAFSGIIYSLFMERQIMYFLIFSP